jgi:hypothetical protein
MIKVNFKRFFSFYFRISMFFVVFFGVNFTLFGQIKTIDKVVEKLENYKTAKQDTQVLTDESYLKMLDKQSQVNFSKTLLSMDEPATFTGNPPVNGLQFFSKTFNTNKEWQKKPFMMEADMKLNYEVLAFRKGNFLCNVHFEPRIVMRMFQNDSVQNDESFAVRTPSYFPLGTVNFTSKKLWNQGSALKQYFSLKTWHHSNGQDGVDFDTQGWFNTRNGDFADILGNELTYTLLKKNVKNFNNEKELKVEKINFLAQKTAKSELFWSKIGFEHHWRKWITGRLSRYQLYGLNRLNINFGWRQSNTFQEYYYSNETPKPQILTRFTEVEKFKATLKFAYIMDKTINFGPFEKWQPITMGDFSKRLNAVASFYYHPKKIQYVGLFAQAGYYGSDPYNSYFQQSLWFYKIGFSTGRF